MILFSEHPHYHRNVNINTTEFVVFTGFNFDKNIQFSVELKSDHNPFMTNIEIRLPTVPLKNYYSYQLNTIPRCY